MCQKTFEMNRVCVQNSAWATDLFTTYESATEYKQYFKRLIRLGASWSLTRDDICINKLKTEAISILNESTENPLKKAP